MKLRIHNTFRLSLRNGQFSHEIELNVPKETLVSQVMDTVASQTRIPVEHFSLTIKENGNWTRTLNPSDHLLEAIPSTFFSRLRFWSSNKAPNSVCIKMQISIQPRAETYIIWVQKMDKTHFLVEVSSTDSVSMLKHLIYLKTDIAPFKQKLLFGGKELRWELSLGEQGIGEMNRVRLTLDRFAQTLQEFREQIRAIGRQNDPIEVNNSPHMTIY